MNIVPFEGKNPTVHPGAYIASTATIIGDVTIEDGVSVWFGAVLRADLCSIVVRAGANIQDNSVLHSREGHCLEIGARVTVGHGCVVHGDRVGSDSVIGNGAVLLNHTVVGARSVIGAGAVVSPGAQIPDGVVAMGLPATVRGPILPGSAAARLVEGNSDAYDALVARYRRG